MLPRGPGDARSFSALCAGPAVTFSGTAVLGLRGPAGEPALAEEHESDTNEIVHETAASARMMLCALGLLCLGRTTALALPGSQRWCTRLVESESLAP